MTGDLLVAFGVYFLLVLPLGMSAVYSWLLADKAS